MPTTLLAAGALAWGLLAGSAIAKESEADAQLREALRQKMSEMESKPAVPAAPTPDKVPATPVTSPASVKPAPGASAAPAVVPTAKEPAAAPTGAMAAPAPLEDPETARLREALHQRMEQEVTNPTPIVEVSPAPSAPATSATAKSQPTGYTPPMAPVLPISGTKQQRLQQLLEQYKADLITPSEYHAQRAKIIAE